MRNEDNPSESIWQDSLQGLMKLTRQFAEVDTLMGDIFKRISGAKDGVPLCDLSLAEVHFLSAVAEFAPCNGAMLTKKTGLTKGGVSKIAARLSSKGMLVSRKMKGNNKSQYFVLTENGKFACRVHDTLHEIARDKIIDSIPEYTKEELATFNGMLKEISTAIAGSSSDIAANFDKYLAEDGVDVALTDERASSGPTSGSPSTLLF